MFKYLCTSLKIFLIEITDFLRANLSITITLLLLLKEYSNNYDFY